MAISEEFLNLFSKLIKDYETGATAGYFTKWDKDHQVLVKEIKTAYEIISNPQTQICFNDPSIIQHYLTTADINDDKNPAFRQVWKNLLKEYKKYDPRIDLLQLEENARLSINVISENPSGNYIKELEAAIEILKKTARQVQESLELQIKILEAKVKALSQQNERLQKENNELNRLIIDRNQNADAASVPEHVGDAIKTIAEFYNGKKASKGPIRDIIPDVPVKSADKEQETIVAEVKPLQAGTYPPLPKSDPPTPKSNTEKKAVSIRKTPVVIQNTFYKELVDMQKVFKDKQKNQEVLPEKKNMTPS